MRLVLKRSRVTPGSTDSATSGERAFWITAAEAAQSDPSRGRGTREAAREAAADSESIVWVGVDGYDVHDFGDKKQKGNGAQSDNHPLSLGTPMRCERKPMLRQIMALDLTEFRLGG